VTAPPEPTLSTSVPSDTGNSTEGFSRHHSKKHSRHHNGSRRHHARTRRTNHRGRGGWR
jgi:hypothetical protein